MDDEIDAWVRANVDPAYHPLCTCKMGSEANPMAVVDSKACVIGTENLRVVDASIIPSIVSGNLNGPTVMMAEKQQTSSWATLPCQGQQLQLMKHPMNKEGKDMQIREDDMKIRIFSFLIHPKLLSFSK